VTAGIAAVQARITELRTLVAPETVAATDLTSATTGTSTTGTSSAASFASALAALGIDASASTSLTSLTGASSAAFTTGPSASATGTATGRGLVAAAEKYIGVPYVWGGETLSEGGLDCSGLVVRSLADIGVTGVPRVARDQMTIGTAVPSLAQALPGDLLVFQGGAHIAIYVGDGKMIDAPKPGKSVAVRDVYTEPTVIRRVLPQATTTTSATSSASTELASALASATAQRTALDLLTQVAS
jgi:cell wall-associated NlpC family hydrolase